MEAILYQGLDWLDNIINGKYNDIIVNKFSLKP